MSDEQKKELKEFENQVKVLMEEREKRRKALEAEYKKIRSDAVELCLKFDESVAELHKEKLDMTSLVYRMEMDIMRLSIALEQCERIDAIREERLIGEIEDLRTKKLTEYSPFSSTRSIPSSSNWRLTFKRTRPSKRPLRRTSRSVRSSSIGC